MQKTLPHVHCHLPARSHCASLKTNRIKAASIFAALNQIRLAGFPYKCQQALVRFVVMAMARRYDRAGCGADTVTFPAIWHILLK
jgi:hypothetical protein